MKGYFCPGVSCPNIISNLFYINLQNWNRKRLSAFWTLLKEELIKFWNEVLKYKKLFLFVLKWWFVEMLVYMGEPLLIDNLVQFMIHLFKKTCLVSEFILRNNNSQIKSTSSFLLSIIASFMLTLEQSKIIDLIDSCALAPFFCTV